MDDATTQLRHTAETAQTEADALLAGLVLEQCLADDEDDLPPIAVALCRGSVIA